MFENTHLNTIVSSAIIYVFIIAALRIFGKKELAQLSVVDLVFVLLISNAVQNSMVGSDDTLLGGILAATTLFILNKLFKFFLYKSEKFHILMEGEPVILVRHGKMNKKQMKKNRLNERELKEACREQGEGDLSQIDLVILEVDGKISILKDEKIEKGSRFDVKP
ncbi:MAG: DUF421 domain-containing protein [Tannerellaceae bacterium]|nr:DUF421 domain-containing protein [Tannerellaceae bacterium]